MKGERKYTAPVAIACALLLLVGVVIKAPAIKQQLNGWKLLPQPERLTELYFEDHTRLPASYSVGQTQLFRFTVHNIEYETLNYSYKITQQSADGSQSLTLASGNFRLDQNKYHTQPIVVTLADLGDRAKVITSLSPVRESIDYIVVKEGV